MNRLAEQEKALSKKQAILAAVYQSVLGTVYRENPSLDENYMTISKEYFAKSLSNPELLAAARTGNWTPLLVKQTDSKYFDDDLLSVLAFQADNFPMLYDYYEAHGKREAACLVAAFMLRDKADNYVKKAANSAFLKQVEEKIDQYKDLAIAGEFQEQADDILMSGGDIDSVDVEAAIAADYRSLTVTPADRYMLFKVMKKWEYTGEEFKDVLKMTEKALYKDLSQDIYGLEKDMRSFLSSKGIDWDILTEQILHYFLYIYFCGSAYDEYYFGQAQLAIATCIHIKDFAMAHFKAKGTITPEDVIYFTYLYARELEHSVPNVLATERYMDEHPLV